MGEVIRDADSHSGGVGPPAERAEGIRATARRGEMPPRRYAWCRPASRLSIVEWQDLLRGLESTLRSRSERVARGTSTFARRDGTCLMKKIEAVIRPFTVDDVTDALIALGVGGLTVTEVRGSGNEADRTQHHLDAHYTTDLVPKAVVEVVVADEVVAAAIATICQMARTELGGDGYVFVLPVSAAIRIRTGEAGEAVLC